MSAELPLAADRTRNRARIFSAACDSQLSMPAEVDKACSALAHTHTILS